MNSQMLPTGVLATIIILSSLLVLSQEQMPVGRVAAV
jgi:hypothetical protein